MPLMRLIHTSKAGRDLQSFGNRELLYPLPTEVNHMSTWTAVTLPSALLLLI